VSLYRNLCRLGATQFALEHYQHLVGGNESIGATNLCDGRDLNLAGDRPILACGNLVVDRRRNATDIYFTRVSDYLFGNTRLGDRSTPTDEKFTIDTVSIHTCEASAISKRSIVVDSSLISVS
jgi:hypothetical protein